MELVITKSGHASKPFLERLELIHGDITQVKADAIATVIPQNLEFKGHLNTALQRAAGYNLDEFILEHIYKPRIGEVYAIPAGHLQAKHILVGIMPQFKNDFEMTESYLSGSVRKIMELARCMLLKSVAFPPLCMGRKAYPKPKGARLIVQGIMERMEESFEEIKIVCDAPDKYEIFQGKLAQYKPDHR